MREILLGLLVVFLVWVLYRGCCHVEPQGLAVGYFFLRNQGWFSPQAL